MARKAATPRQIAQELRLREKDFAGLLDQLAASAAEYGDPEPPEVLAVREEIRRRWTAAYNDDPYMWAAHLNLTSPDRTVRFSSHPEVD